MLKGSRKKADKDQTKEIQPVKVVGFGRNYFYPLTDDYPNISTRDVPWTDSLPVSMACSAQSTVVLNDKGKIHQVGTLHGVVMPKWTRIEVPFPGRCKEVSAGRHFCLALNDNGVVVSWGAGHFGQLASSTEQPISFSPSPMLIERLLQVNTGSKVCSVACGNWHALALTESGAVWAWGSNRSYQCGLKQQKQPFTVAQPLPVQNLPKIRQIAAGRSHSCTIARNGQVYCFGASHHGQCGTGTITRRNVPGILPTHVDGLLNLEMVSIAAAGHHCIAVSKAGRVFGWGDNSEGQLGVGGFEKSSKPRLIVDLDFVIVAAGQRTPAEKLADLPRIQSVYASDHYSAAVSSSGHLYCWGCNDAGQTGVKPPSDLTMRAVDESSDCSYQANEREMHEQTFDSKHNLLLPMRVEALDEMRVEKVALGPNHMWCVGRERCSDDETIVGKTLYEVEQEQPTKDLNNGLGGGLDSLPFLNGNGKILASSVFPSSAVTSEQASLGDSDDDENENNKETGAFVGDELESSESASSSFPASPMDPSITSATLDDIIPSESQETFGSSDAILETSEVIESGSPMNAKKSKGGIMRRISKGIRRRLSSTSDRSSRKIEEPS
jgi:alpha-tubulin suppressor-like RCC1 family protein